LSNVPFDPVLQWGVAKCGFPAMWNTLDVEGSDPGPIGLIDNGSHHRHPELADRIVDYIPPRGTESIADHASSVAGIISARRSEVAVEGRDLYGCCSARLVLYNVWTRDAGVEDAAIVRALNDAVKRKLPVVNMSVTAETNNPDIAKALARCAAANVIVVAAAGNCGVKSPILYPAADENVIAVAATDPDDNRWYDSTVSKSVFIAAPGQRIWSVVGDSDYDYVDGTSFAAPFVTAAIWLAKRRHPALSLKEAKDLLRLSVSDPGRPRDNKLGYGRLDMPNLLNALDSKYRKKY
jgi:subtilisin family serine protease